MGTLLVALRRGRRPRFVWQLGMAAALWFLSAALAPRLAGAVCDPMHADWQCLAPVTVEGGPVAPAPKDMNGKLMVGTGLCGAFKQSGTPRMTFPSRTTMWPSDKQNFSIAANAFMDQRGAVGLDGPRIDETLRQRFDLSNNVDVVGDRAAGDFYTAGCFPSMFGCPFPGSQSGLWTSAFGTRFRGYLLVREDQVNSPIHFGIFADNAAAVSIFSVPKPPAPSRPLDEQLVVSHALDFNPKFRVTNTVTFRNAGLYPIEIVHANFDSGAILEFVVMFGFPNWKDLDQLYNPMMTQFMLSQEVSGRGPDDDRAAFGFYSLSDPVTDPENFFQTTSGAPPYSAPEQCRQCPRIYADEPGQTPSATGCDPHYFCNTAAVCAPCDRVDFCGDSCEPCRGATPYCVPVNPGDPTNTRCVQCRDTPDCALGQLCIGHVCTTPDLCCPDRPFLIAPDDKVPTVKVCSPCRTADDCGPGMKCDRLNARCIKEIPQYNTDEECGPERVNCKQRDANRPRCLDGLVCVQCRNDFECEPGKYCLSGDCTPCIHDRHCGKRCESCGRSLSLAADGMSADVRVTDEPFCFSPDDTVEKATCVRCVKDADCGEGGNCDTDIHECKTNNCDPPCAPGQFCDRTRCVECYSSSQCPCGQCDLSTGTCTGLCETNKDCMGNQCCRDGEDGLRKCQPGRCAGVAGGALCGCSAAAMAPPLVDNDTFAADAAELGRSRGLLAAGVALGACALWLRRRRRVLQAAN